MFIRATGNISPQRTFGHPAFLAEPVEFTGNRLTCTEPDYKTVIDLKYIRRMSRIIKMGVAAALECLQEAGISNPGAIVTGTAYGCMEDTGIFMKKLVENKEELLTPTSFIQSTHNTVGAQVALILSCHCYNNTYVHRGFSFESALLDAMLLLREKEAAQVLVGSADEITDYSHAILSRFGLYKARPSSNINLYKDRTKGTIGGEGAAFFALSNEPSATDYAVLNDMTTFYQPADNARIEEQIGQFLATNSISINEVDLVINGRNGDLHNDNVYDHLNGTLFKESYQISYKHLCGEYPTAVSFALWVASNVLKTKNIPAAFGATKVPPENIRNILIYNHYLGVHHSLLLISAC
jgi:3-oxoacyl-(acyl-carrier-protein) synthase